MLHNVKWKNIFVTTVEVLCIESESLPGSIFIKLGLRVKFHNDPIGGGGEQQRL